MLEQLIERILPTIIAALEPIGTFIVAVSALSASDYYLKSLLIRTPCDIKFASANGPALSLGFKVVTEILETVSVQDLKELLVLGAVIPLWTLLSFLIHFEMKGTHSPK